MIQLVLTEFHNKHETFSIYFCNHVSSDTCCKKGISARIVVIRLNFGLKWKLIFPLTRDLEMAPKVLKLKLVSWQLSFRQGRNCYLSSRYAPNNCRLFHCFLRGHVHCVSTVYSTAILHLSIPFRASQSLLCLQSWWPLQRWLESGPWVPPWWRSCIQ